MGKIIDTAEVDHVSVGTLDGEEFYVITFKNSLNGWTEGRMIVDESKDGKLDPSVWKPGAKVIARWEESEWDGARVNAISDELYNAKRSNNGFGNSKYLEIINNLSKEELEELEWQNRDKNFNVMYTNKQIEIHHYD